MNDLSCKPNFNLLLSRDVNSPRLCYGNKRWLVIILKLLLLSRDVNSPRLCYVNKDGGGVNDLASKPNFELIILKLLLSRGVNSPRLCYVNKEVDSVTPCLSCYGKQRRHFEFETIWRTRAVILN